MCSLFNKSYAMFFRFKFIKKFKVESKKWQK